MSRVFASIPVPERLVHDPAAEAEAAAERRRKRLLFAAVFVVGSVVGLAYTFARPAQYRSEATLRVDASTTAPAGADGAERAAAVERELLSDHDLLKTVLDRVGSGPGVPASVVALGEVLSVQRVEDTGLLRLAAVGDDPRRLARLVNTWLDVYRERQVASRDAETAAADGELQRQLAALEQQVGERRAALERFREANDISSLQRDENQVLARLKGLNEALAKATQTSVDARAKLGAVRDAEARGQPLVRDQDRATLATLQRQAGTLRAQVETYRNKYTPQYIAINPEMARAVRDLDEVEKEIRSLTRSSAQAQLVEAEQNLAAARAAEADLQAQIGAQKATVARFSARFAEHEALQKELEQLETLLRDTRTRLTQAQVDREGRFARVGIVSRAFVPDAPFYPHYGRDAVLSVVAAALLGLLAVALRNLFIARPAAAPTTLTQVIAVAAPGADMPPLPGATVAAALPAAPDPPRLGQALPRELTLLEVRALLDAADEPTRWLVMLPFCGLSRDEVAQLTWQQLDLDAGRVRVRVPGRGERVLALPALLATALRSAGSGPAAAPLWADADGQPLDAAELEAMLACAVCDAGLSRPAEIGLDALHHSYLAFLVRQGLRLSELRKVVGATSSARLAGYGALSPPMPGLALEQIDTTYPALRPPALPAA